MVKFEIVKNAKTILIITKKINEDILTKEEVLKEIYKLVLLHVIIEKYIY